MIRFFFFLIKGFLPLKSLETGSLMIIAHSFPFTNVTVAIELNEELIGDLTHGGTRLATQAMKQSRVPPHERAFVLHLL